MLVVIHWVQIFVVKQTHEGLSLTDLAPFLEPEGLVGSAGVRPDFFLGPPNQSSRGSVVDIHRL